jgi:hypothetical protein
MPEDPLVVVLGSTTIFSKLSQRVWFVDAAEEALHLVPDSANHQRIHKNWFAADIEMTQADLLVGDGSVNAIDSQQGAQELLNLFAQHLKKGALLAQRIFIRHELSAEEFSKKLIQAFMDKRYCEIRLLIYGVVANSNGETSIANIDNYINTLEAHIYIDPKLAATYKQQYFEWRGISAEAAAQIKTAAFFPSYQQIEAMFDKAGLKVTKINAGTFPLAEYTPIYIATI